jgi:hypothetical protein
MSSAIPSKPKLGFDESGKFSRELLLSQVKNPLHAEHYDNAGNWHIFPLSTVGKVLMPIAKHIEMLCDKIAKSHDGFGSLMANNPVIDDEGKELVMDIKRYWAKGKPGYIFGSISLILKEDDMVCTVLSFKAGPFTQTLGLHAIEAKKLLESESSELIQKMLLLFYEKPQNNNA